MTEHEVAAAIREILVAAKRRAGYKAIAISNAIIDEAAPAIARLMIRLVDTAIDDCECRTGGHRPGCRRAT